MIEVARGNVPVVVVDLPHQWTGWVRRQLREADDVVIVATPDLANLRNAKNLAEVLRASRPNDAPPRLVFNQVGMPKRPEIKLEEFAKALDLEIAATIGFDAALFGNAANKGLMIGELDAKHQVAGHLPDPGGRRHAPRRGPQGEEVALRTAAREAAGAQGVVTRSTR